MFREVIVMEQGELKKLIDKLNNEKIDGLNVQEQTQIYNALKDLEIYKKIGTIEQFIAYKGVEQAITNRLN